MSLHFYDMVFVFLGTYFGISCIAVTTTNIYRQKSRGALVKVLAFIGGHRVLLILELEDESRHSTFLKWRLFFAICKDIFVLKSQYKLKKMRNTLLSQAETRLD